MVVYKKGPYIKGGLQKEWVIKNGSSQKGGSYQTVAQITRFFINQNIMLKSNEIKNNTN